LKNYIRKNYDKAGLLSLDSFCGQDDEDLNLGDILPNCSVASCFDFVNTKLVIERINNNGLTTREKEVFNLSLEGLTTREMGERLGISHVMVVKLKSRIKEKCLQHFDR
jgi:DNA-directed RNA polymerase specialized sigma subunit